MNTAPACARSHLQEYAHERIHNIPALLHSRDVALCGALHRVSIELTSEVQHSTEVLIPRDVGQLIYSQDPVLRQERLKHLALTPLQGACTGGTRQLCEVAHGRCAA